MSSGQESRRPVPYRARRRRRRWRAVAVVSVFAVAAALVWTHVWQVSRDVDAQVSCPAPATGPVGRPLPYAGLDSVTPVPAGAIAVRVLNSSNQRGLATEVDAQLQGYGFTSAAPPANDPAFPDDTMGCVGQIRFGVRAAGAARTLSFLVPCAQLVQDDRQDSAVDLALGTNFTQLTPTSAALDVLRQLDTGAGQHPRPTAQSDDATPPSPAPDLLAAAHPGHC